MLSQTYPSALMPHKRIPGARLAAGIIGAPAPRPILNVIDPVAFFLALFSAPIIVALLGFWALFIPVGALYFGYVPYLVIGTPILIWELSRHDPSPARCAWLAFLACGAFNIGRLALHADPLATGRYDDLALFALVSLLMAPIWGASFAGLYRFFRRGVFTELRP